MVNGAFARAFTAEVQPVELAAALQREIDDRAAITGRDRIVVPNIFQVELSTHDFDRLAVYRDALQTELADLALAYVEAQRYTLLGSVRVLLGLDHDLETGIFRVRSESRAEVSSPHAGPADMDSHQPRLILDDMSYPLIRAVTRLGRGSDTDIRIDDPGCSRDHCEIVLGDPALVRDLHSTNGTYVNGSKIREAPIKDGGRLSLGSTTLIFRSG